MEKKRGRGRSKTTVPPSLEILIGLKTPEHESPVNVQTPEIEPRTTAEEDKDMTNTVAKENKKTLTEPTQPQPEERKPWVDVINDNRNPAKGMAIEYVVPKIVNGVIEIDIIEQEDIETEIQFWDNALIFYVVGAT
ncbi:unnamed protein product [Lathyrus sativus]|nr:unnamed protein product [Lathyrus sativus]